MTGFGRVLTDVDLLKRWDSKTNVMIDEAVKNGLPCYRRDDSGKLIGCSYEELLRLRSDQRSLLKNTGGWVQVGQNRRKRVEKLWFYFYESDVREYETKYGITPVTETLEGGNTKAKSNKISAYALSKSELFKKIVPAIMELGVLFDRNSNVKKDDAVKKILIITDLGELDSKKRNIQWFNFGENTTY